MTEDRVSVHAPVVDLSRHDGGLRPAIGTVNTQVLRANRAHPEDADGFGWSYNHAPMLAWWNGTFYLEYLSDPVSEHVPPGQTLLMTSNDGADWSKPVVVFPEYEVPDGVYRNPSEHPLPPGSPAVMHQRMGFYVAPNGRLLVLGFYGICPQYRVNPNDGKGIGRVVREMHKDGSFGDIYFIRYNSHAGWHRGNTDFPFYEDSTDPEFIDACAALLRDRLVTMQWWEEDRSDDGFYSVAGERAPSTYRLPDGRVVAIWKFGRAAISEDDGASWAPVHDIAGMITSGGKAWGQRLSDGRYALVYNPSPTSQMRWPLAVATSDDGLRFVDLVSVHGEVSPIRYHGLLKDHGPSYVRGIETTDGVPDDALWLTYSVNKEDIWVTRVPVPITTTVSEPVDDPCDDLRHWNVYRGQWSPVDIVPHPSTSGSCLLLGDRDPYGHATAERVFPESTRTVVEWSALARQTTGTQLFAEICDHKGTAAMRVVLDSDGRITYLSGGRYRELATYRADEWLAVRIELDVPRQRCRLTVGDAAAEQAFVAPVASVERLTLRTGPRSTTPDLETPVDGPDLTDPGEPTEGGSFLIDWVRTSGHE